MRRRLKRVALSRLLLAWVGVGVGAPGVPCQDLATWRIGSRILQVGQNGEVALHRVRAATALSRGRIAIADAGNARVVIVQSTGAVDRAFGREGEGPGEFRSLSDLQAVNDTLITYDSQASQVAVWLIDGTLVLANRLPSYQNLTTDLAAPISALELLVVTRPGMGEGRDGLYLRQSQLLRTDLATRSLTHLSSLPWSYTYRYSVNGGTTGYRTPFLGQTRVRAVQGQPVVAPLDEPVVRIGVGIEAIGTVPMPLGASGFDRDIVTAHGDSIVRSMSDESRRRYPNAVSAIQAVFGEDFPEVERLAWYQDARIVGSHLWLQPVAWSERADRWYIVDVSGGRLAAQIEVPLDWQVLGGTDSTVIVLRRDELDVEFVEVYEVLR